MSVRTPVDADVRRRVDEWEWYHCIDLGGGVVTPGWFDLRATTSKVPLPERLDGMRCLDVGTWDGFWAFEMERRGAASIMAIDVDDPSGWDWSPRSLLDGSAAGGQARTEQFKEDARGFHLAREVLGSSVERVAVSVYDLDPAEHGMFDMVFFGSLLLHLRDPVRALAAVRAVCSGEAVVADTVDAIPSLLRRRTPVARLEGQERPWWWQPNVAGLHQMVRSAGFDIAERTGLYLVPRGPRHPRQDWRQAPRQLLSARGREDLIIGARGIPHAAVLARPLAAG